MSYCDGTGHQGYKKDPVVYKGKKIFFRGHNITIGTFDQLDKDYGLFSDKTSEIVITGESAGGLAVSLWSEYI